MWALLPPHGQTPNSSSPPRSWEPAQHNTPATNPLSSPSYASLSEPTINEVPKLLPYEEDSKELDALRSCWLSLPSASHQLWEYFSVAELHQTNTPKDNRKLYKCRSGKLQPNWCANKGWNSTFSEMPSSKYPPSKSAFRRLDSAHYCVTCRGSAVSEQAPHTEETWWVKSQQEEKREFNNFSYTTNRSLPSFLFLSSYEQQFASYLKTLQYLPVKSYYFFYSAAHDLVSSVMQVPKAPQKYQHMP